ncbi:MAG: cytochrome c3 family protein [Bdellovibrionota bacterium]
MILAKLLIFLPLSWAAGVPARPTCSTSGCHSEIKSFPHLHGPVKANGCTVCHQPGPQSASLPANHPGIVTPAKINSVCITCHDDKAGTGLPVAHSPVVNKNCTTCHNPHGSRTEHLLKAESVSALCVSCHKDIGKADHGGHTSVLTEGRSCVFCHDPHFAHHDKLLREDQKSLCLSCHGKQVKKKDGETLIAVGRQLSESPVQHKPFHEGRCSECHDQHGSSAHRFLRKPFSDTDPALCLGCHKESAFSAASGAATQFRNGDENLHYFHLHQQNQTISCKSCHEVHAGTQPKLIRTQFTFNGWQVPIQFAKTPSGGTCTSACHGEKKYDRIEASHNNAGR